MMRQDTTFCTSIKFCPWANNIHINSLIWQYSSPSTLPMGNFGMPSMYYLCTTTTTTANEKKKIKKRELINVRSVFIVGTYAVYLFPHKARGECQATLPRINDCLLFNYNINLFRKKIEKKQKQNKSKKASHVCPCT